MPYEEGMFMQSQGSTAGGAPPESGWYFVLESRLINHFLDADIEAFPMALDSIRHE